MTPDFTRRELIRAGGAGAAGIALLGRQRVRLRRRRRRHRADEDDRAAAGEPDERRGRGDGQPARRPHLRQPRADGLDGEGDAGGRPLRQRLPRGHADDPRAAGDHGRPAHLPVPGLEAEVGRPAGAARLGARRQRRRDVDRGARPQRLDDRLRHRQPAPACCPSTRTSARASTESCSSTARCRCARSRSARCRRSRSTTSCRPRSTTASQSRAWPPTWRSTRASAPRRTSTRPRSSRRA